MFGFFLVANDPKSEKDGTFSVLNLRNFNWKLHLVLGIVFVFFFSSVFIVC